MESFEIVFLSLGLLYLLATYLSQLVAKRVTSAFFFNFKPCLVVKWERNKLQQLVQLARTRILWIFLSLYFIIASLSNF